MRYEHDSLESGLAELAGHLLSDETVEHMLRSVSNLAVTTLEGCEIADVMIVGAVRVRSAAASDARAETLDDAQYDADDGPCLDAARGRHVNFVESTYADGRWPEFCGAAREVGVLSALAIPLVVKGESLGVLNLYSTVEAGFPEASRRAAGLFAAQAAIVVSNAQAHAAALATVSQLRAALESRSIIDQAKGILMAEAHCSSEDAFEILRRRSQRENRKLRLVADDVIRETLAQA